jgi:small subunit ribosomal protein S8
MDKIVDLLNQIRNAQAVQKLDFSISASNLKYEIAKLLESNGFIADVKKTNKGKMKTLKITLKYENGLPKIAGLKRVSKQGQRIYHSNDEIRKVMGGYGISIVSTSKGLMIGKDAKKQNLGGEVICEVW